MRVHNGIFVFIVVLGGCMPNLSFMQFGQQCLQTGSPDNFSMDMSDQYQYLLSVLLWVILVPIIFISMSIVIKDQSQLICVPVLIANLIFGFLMVFMSLFIIIYIVLYSNN